ncbi:MAG: metallophosphoesterase family protein [Nitrospirota bacterium]
MIDFGEVKSVLARDGKLIRLPSRGKAVFVGDTHGDFDATETVFKNYLKPGFVLVFLGDYVDRGPESKENIEFLLRKKMAFPDQIFLLAGNHEGYCSVPFSPADFWENLAPHEYEFFSEVCSFFSFAAVTENGIIAVHGVPPDVETIDEIDQIQLCGDNWMELTWGDFAEMPGELLSSPYERPRYGEDYFRRVMTQLGTSVVIRSHQPRIKSVIFDKRCLTLMTSYAYSPVRIIAIADLQKRVIDSTEDLEVIEI